MNISNVQDEIFTSIAAEVKNPRQLESLTRLKHACDYLAKNRLPITPMSVERYCLDRGWDGPKAQSIRNSRSVLADYLRHRRAKQVVPRALGKKSLEPVIHDETLRAHVMMLTQERDQAVAARTRIEKALRTIPGIPVDELIQAGFGQTPDGPLRTLQVLSPEAIGDLNKLFDTYTLEQCGLELYKDRIRQSTTKNVLLDSTGFKALKELMKRPASRPHSS